MNDGSSRDLLIALSLLPFLTPARTRLLRQSFVPLDSACDAPARLLADLLRLTPAQVEEVKNPLTPTARRRVAALRETVVTLADSDYPPLLREIVDPPLALHVRGDVSSLSSTMIAIVGSRRASPYAINVAERLAGELAREGLVVVSGLARGVDAAAHAATMAAGRETVAVLGTGIDLVYPRSHTRLARQIETCGALISEFPPETPPRAENFPMRNRVISGLSVGVVVVEATGRSGSLITARMAAEQGRDVFAVPGSIFAAGSEGTHRLIQSGAKLVHDAADVLEEIQPGYNAPKECAPAAPMQGERSLVLSRLTLDEAVSVDDLASSLGSTPADVSQSLLELELEGWIRALPGARYVRTR